MNSMPGLLDQTMPEVHVIDERRTSLVARATAADESVIIIHPPRKDFRLY